MRGALVLAILNSIIKIWSAHGFVVVTIACAGALIVMALVRQTRAGLTRAQSPRRQPSTPIPTRASLPHENGRPLPTTAHHPQSFTDATARALHNSSSSDLPPRPAFARERNLFASAFDAPGETPASSGDDAPEDAIAPPIWRRVESLIEAHRVATLALTGEALGEAVLIEPPPPIWRDMSALRIEVAEMTGAPEAAERETEWASAPPPPIWRTARLHELTGLRLARTTSSSDGDEVESLGLSEIAGAAPIWTTWVSSDWPETRTISTAQDLTTTDARSVRSAPPIWASHVRQR